MTLEVAGAETGAGTAATSRCSSSESATMQLRTSPGGSMFKSSRRRPEEPPSSVTVTIAARSQMRDRLALWDGPPVLEAEAGVRLVQRV